MINRQQLHDKLTDAFINYQYRLEHPMPHATENVAIQRNQYRQDPMFHSKVNSMVAGVMAIVASVETE